MPHDPARVADTKAWLAKARSDVRAGEFEPFRKTLALAREVIEAVVAQLHADIQS